MSKVLVMKMHQLIALRKWASNLLGHKRNIKRCPTLLIIREMQIKTTMRNHLTPQIINAGEAVERREPSYIVGGNANWYSHYGEHYEGP